MPQPRIHASAAQRQAAYRRRQEQVRQKERAEKGLPPAPPIPSIAGWKRWGAMFAMAHAILEGALGEMQDYFDERSESWQESQRGDEHQERMTAVEAVLDALSDLTG